MKVQTAQANHFLSRLLNPTESSKNKDNNSLKKNLFRFGVFQLVLVACFFLRILDTRRHSVYNASIAYLISLDVFLLTLGRSYIKIFNVFYGLAVVVYGYHIVDLNNAAVESALNIFVNPLMILVLSDSVTGMLISSIGQVPLIPKFFAGSIRHSICSADAETEVLGATIFITVFYTISIFLYREYRKAQHTLEEAYKIQNTFLLSFSHELKNPLNSIMGSLQIALKSPANENREYIESALVASEILLQFIHNILDNGKLDIEQLDVSPVRTNFRNFIEKVWNVGRMIIKEQGLKGHVHISNDIPENVKFDEHRITQIFMNLIGNSIKFTKKGRISIHCSWIPYLTNIKEKMFEPLPFSEDEEGLFERDLTLKLHDIQGGDSLVESQSKLIRRGAPKQYRNNNGVLKVCVIDTGCGMNEEQLNNLFKKFSQVSSEVNYRQKGTGLGLFLCRNIILKMGGVIKAFSKLNTGSVFVFLIPISDE